MKLAATVLGVPPVCVSSASAQSETARYRINISRSGEDRVGQQLVYSVRELVAKSALFVEVSEDDSLGDEISLVTVDVDSPDSGNASAVSAMYTVIGICTTPTKATNFVRYAAHNVFVIGVNRIEIMAKTIIAAYSGFLERTAAQHKNCHIKNKFLP